MIYTKCGTTIATGYTRVVTGERGSYVEFSPEQIIWSSLMIPEDEKGRIGSSWYYYLEYRTIDFCNVKVYHQKKLVNYADYKIGMLYIYISDITTE